jgi:hypothetical protein
MSEVRKKLLEETREWLRKGNVILPKDFTGKSEEDMLLRVAEMRALEKKTNEEIKRKQEEIKRKKEELRLKREDELAKFRSIIIHQIDDEDHGIKTYEGIILVATRLGLAENARDLQNILNEEHRHRAILQTMKGTWITHKR